MLRVMSGALRSKTLYRDPETDYKALIVQRNAPRWIRVLKKYGIDATTGWDQRNRPTTDRFRRNPIAQHTMDGPHRDPNTLQLCCQ